MGRSGGVAQPQTDDAARACVICTSRHDRAAKGVAVSRRTAVNLIQPRRACRDRLVVMPVTACSRRSPVGFDVSIGQLLLPALVPVQR